MVSSVSTRWVVVVVLVVHAFWMGNYSVVRAIAKAAVLRQWLEGVC